LSVLSQVGCEAKWGLIVGLLHVISYFIVIRGIWFRRISHAAFKVIIGWDDFS
jgi:hypothetical protein